jgi:tRNA U54 and U55 pseudouridine synthase Pus10
MATLSIMFSDYKPVLNKHCTCTITAQHESIYVAGRYSFVRQYHIVIQEIHSGRYNKYSRILSQTPWIIDGMRKADTSVEELIALPISQLVTSQRM